MTPPVAGRRATILRLIMLIAVAAAIIALARNRELLAPGAIRRGLARCGPFAPIMFIAIYAVATALFVPGSLLTLAGGAIFGPVLGALWNLIGATLGATLAFLIARYAAAEWVARRAGQRLGRIIRGVEEEGWRFVAFVRLVPLFPFNVVNYAFGLTRIRLAEYMIASFVCMAPGAIAYTWLGYAGRAAATGEAGAIRTVTIALALLAAVAFIPRLVRRLRQVPDDARP